MSSINQFTLKKKGLFSTPTIMFLLFSNISYSQTLDLRKLFSFEDYTSTETIANSGNFTESVV